MLHALQRSFFARRHPSQDEREALAFADTELGVQLPPWPAMPAANEPPTARWRKNWPRRVPFPPADLARAFDKAEAASTPRRFGDSERQRDAVRIAHANGLDAGLRQGYIEGMHWGLGFGAIAGALLIALLHLAYEHLWPLVLAQFA